MGDGHRILEQKFLTLPMVVHLGALLLDYQLASEGVSHLPLLLFAKVVGLVLLLLVVHNHVAKRELHR